MHDQQKNPVVMRDRVYRNDTKSRTTTTGPQRCFQLVTHEHVKHPCRVKVTLTCVYMRDQLEAPLWSCVTCVYMRDQLKALSWSRVTCMYMRAQVEAPSRSYMPSWKHLRGHTLVSCTLTTAGHAFAHVYVCTPVHANQMVVSCYQSWSRTSVYRTVHANQLLVACDHSWWRTSTCTPVLRVYTRRRA